MVWVRGIKIQRKDLVCLVVNRGTPIAVESLLVPVLILDNGRELTMVGL